MKRRCQKEVYYLNSQQKAVSAASFLLRVSLSARKPECKWCGVNRRITQKRILIQGLRQHAVLLIKNGTRQQGFRPFSSFAYLDGDTLVCYTTDEIQAVALASPISSATIWWKSTGKTFSLASDGNEDYSLSQCQLLLSPRRFSLAKAEKPVLEALLVREKE